MATTPARQRSNGWKRRTAKACDSCRQKRIKCSGSRPTCSQCDSTEAACHYSDRIDRQISHRPERRESNVRRLQARVRELEAAQNLEPDSSPSQRQSSTDTEPQRTRQHPEAIVLPVPPVKDSAGRETMVAENTGELRYFGPSSSVSVLSPDGLHWIESRTSDASLRQRLEMPLNGTGSWASWTHPLLQSLWPTTLSTPLPPWGEAFALVNEFLESHNTVLPIFHPPTLIGLLGQQYARSVTAIDDPVLSAALNAILALAQRTRAEQNPHKQDLADRAWAYAKNSLEAVMAVLMRSVSLLSVQVLLTLACFFRGTPNPQPFFFLTAAALRLSHSAGLHRAIDHPPLSTIDREQRLRVFWIALVFDSRASIRTGRPFAHDINDIGIPLPSESPKDNLGMIVNRNGTAILNVLLVEAKFAIIEGKVYNSIFAACSSGKSIEQLSADAHALGKELDDWGRIALRGMDCSTITNEWGHQLPAVINLLLSYYSCVITVYTATWQRYFSSMRGASSTQRELDRSSPVFPNTERCLHAAHEIIKLLAFVPREDHSFIWEIIHFPVQALLLLFICILQQPGNPDVGGRFEAIDDAIVFISRIVTTQEDSFLRPVLAVCRELARIARLATQKASVRMDRSERDPAGTFVGDQGSIIVTPHTTQDSMSSVLNLPNRTMEHDNGGPSIPSNNASDARNVDFPNILATVGNESRQTTPLFQNVDIGTFRVDQLDELPLPFSWNWHDLSAGLLEDFEFM